MPAATANLFGPADSTCRSASCGDAHLACEGFGAGAVGGVDDVGGSAEGEEEKKQEYPEKLQICASGLWCWIGIGAVWVLDRGRAGLPSTRFVPAILRCDRYTQDRGR